MREKQPCRDPTSTRDPEGCDSLAQARSGNPRAFERLVAPYRRLLHNHCYRMLGSPQDADDALLAAWRGLGSFEGRSALGTWLYTIGTHVCLRMISRRPRRIESPEHGPSLHTTADLGVMVTGPVWLEPLCDDDMPALVSNETDPARTLALRESVALAFVAAVQHLPGTQRAVLLLRDVLDFTAAETAETLETSVASVNSALQRARKTMKDRLPAVSQAAELQRLGEEGVHDLLAAFVTAWESRNIEGLVRLLTEDARFTMPPLPAWFDGRSCVERFIVERVFATPWRMVPLRVNGQPGFACYMLNDGADRFRLGAITVLNLRGGRISALHSFLDPAVHRRFGLAQALPGDSVGMNR
jgi:RNA polymerase sigma-70 factor (TIGR02960 family)